MKNFFIDNLINNITIVALLAAVFFGISGCFPEEKLNVPVKDSNAQLMTELDQFIDENFVQEFDVAIRYRYDNNFVGPGERATPPKLDVVRPVIDFLDYYWFEPFLAVENGEEFFRRFVPAEVVFLGGPIFQSNGTVLLGRADAGARITLTYVNAYDPDNAQWRDLQLGTIYHEFAHVVHQNFKLPASFEQITPSGYTGPGSWFILSDDEALQRGFVSPYGTSSPNEDFAEIVAFYLFDQNFFSTYIIEEENCTTENCVLRNEGRLKISEKLASIKSHYEKVTGIDLDELRDEIQSRIN